MRSMQPGTKQAGQSPGKLSGDPEQSLDLHSGDALREELCSVERWLAAAANEGDTHVCISAGRTWHIH